MPRKLENNLYLCLSVWFHAADYCAAPWLFPGMLLKWLLYDESELLVTWKGILLLSSWDQRAPAPSPLLTCHTGWVPFSHLILPQLLSTEKCLAAHLPLFQKLISERRKKEKGSPVLAAFPCQKIERLYLERETWNMGLCNLAGKLLSVERQPSRDRTTHVSERVKQ